MPLSFSAAHSRRSSYRRIPGAQLVLAQHIAGGRKRSCPRSATDMSVRADSAAAVEAIRHTQAPEERSLVIDGERAAVGHVAGGQGQESRGIDIAVGGNEHD